MMSTADLFLKFVLIRWIFYNCLFVFFFLVILKNLTALCGIRSNTMNGIVVTENCVVFVQDPEIHVHKKDAIDYSYLYMEGSGKLEATLGSHSLILRIMEGMQSQMLNFLIILKIIQEQCCASGLQDQLYNTLMLCQPVYCSI